MELTIFLNDNTNMPVTMESYSATQMAASLNERQMSVFTIGSTVLSKNIVSCITPAEGTLEEVNVEIHLNNGKKMNEYVENYQAEEITEQINNPVSIMFVIGNSVFNKNLIRMIKPLEQTTV